MKTPGLLILFLVLFVTPIFAQDTIVLKDGGKFNVRVITAGSQTVSYRLFNEPEGPLHSMQTKTIAMIKYQNGDIRDFLIKKKDYAFKSNLLAFHLMRLLVGDFTMSFEYIVKSGKMGFQIPIAIGFSNDFEFPVPPPFENTENNFHNKFYTGLAVNFYPTGQGKVKYFVGPSLLFGAGYFEDNNHYNYESKVNSNYTKLLINNGLVISPIPSFSLVFNAGLGIRTTFNTDYVDGNETTTTAALSINLVYRF